MATLTDTKNKTAEVKNKTAEVKNKTVQEKLPTRGGALGATYDEAERLLAVETKLAPGETPETNLPGPGIAIAIAGVRTVSQAGNQNAFLLNTDALTLVIDVSATPDLVNSGAKFDANFEIIEYATNNVKVNNAWNAIPFSWGTDFWISQGNNWGPKPTDYTTPAKWGLAAGIYLYRATVAVEGLNAFAFSTEVSFRVR
jgi:hypothetical protein